jgi:hypothetical protein
LTVQNGVLSRSGDLVALVQFTSFGNVPTPVEMVYRIEDVNNKEVFTENDRVTVETQQLVTKEFKNLTLGNGKYTLVLATTYGDNIKDVFRQVFEIKTITAKQSLPIIPILGTLAGVFVFGLFMYLKRKIINK